MRLTLTARHRPYPLAAPFRISRGVKTVADVVEVTLEQDGLVGRGEAVPYARYDETIDLVLSQIEAVRSAMEGGADRTTLAALMAAGAARNALDCALWDLEAARVRRTGAAPLLSPPAAVISAQTISLDTPEIMAEQARRHSQLQLLKVKVDALAPEAQIRAVRAAAPDARLIVDPNESWDVALLLQLQPVLAEARVDLIEQPLPADADDALLGLQSVAPICADESCHTSEDLERLHGRYQAINIKLDKTGGLTEALRLYQDARAQGMQVMVGCMVCSSLGIAPALQIAAQADFVDLDGPLWLRDDHAGGVRMHNGLLAPPAPGFWGY